MPATALAPYGFVNRLCESGKSLETALALANQICVNAPLAVRLSLKMVNQCSGLLSEKEQQAVSDTAFPELAKTDDFKEGPLAFIEKRAPKWTGKRSKL